jgi:hypothetical protein
MGGYGSGERWSSKSTTDHALRLNVRWLAREGLTEPGAYRSMTVSWTSNGKPAGNILVCHDARRPDELVLHYSTRARGEPTWTDVREVVRLDWTPCHYGGSRVWCRCPGCGKRKAVLYSLYGAFRCVAC